MNANTRCVFITGLPCAGKSAYGRLARKLGYAVAEWSSFLRDDTGCSTDRSEFHSSVGEIVERKGVEYYPRRIFDRMAEWSTTQHVVIGARNPKELAYFRSLYAVSAVVWISATYRQRFLRNNTRQREDADHSIEQFLASDFHELSNGLADIAATHVGEIIFNEGLVEEFDRRVARHLQEFLGDVHGSVEPL